MKRFFVFLVVGHFFLASPRVSAQLADTIWEAEVEILNLNLQAVREGTPAQGPNLKNGSITLPMEIWFWNGTQCGLVFPTEKWGFREYWHDEWDWTDGLGNLVHEFYTYMGPKYWGGGSLAPSYENENDQVQVTSTYAYNASKKTGTLFQQTLYLVGTSTRDLGSYWRISGSFFISGNKLTVKSATFTLVPNPSGINSYKVLSAPRLKTGTTFVKTSRKPSTEKDVQASFKYFSESSWDSPPVVSDPTPPLATPF